MSHPFVKWNASQNAYEDSVVYRHETGERFPCWPVDARELVASGEYSYTPPRPPAPDETDSESEATGDAQEGQRRGRRKKAED